MISIIAIFAVANGVLIQIIMASRVFYGMVNQNWLPKIFFDRVSLTIHTPVLATIVVTVAIVVMPLWLPIESLARVTSFLLLIIFSLVNLSLWKIKLRKKEPSKHFFEIPLWIPITGFSAAVALLLIEIANRLSA